MRMFSLAVAAGLTCLLMSSGGAMAACKASADPLFEDQFLTLDDTWGTYDNYGVEDGRLAIKPPAGYNTSTLNNSSLYDDVDICVEMTGQAPLPEGACGSVIFWAIDFDNYYSFQISPEGQASFWRRQRGKWLNQVSSQDAQGIEKGATVINELRVITKGKTAKLFINGTLFRDVKGQPPKDGSLIGLLACSPNQESATISFDNLVVNTPSAETEPVSAKGAAGSGEADKGAAEQSDTGGAAGSGAGAAPGGSEAAPGDSGGSSGGGDSGGEGAPSIGPGSGGGSGG
jgi:hypothetical protein